MRDDGPAPDAVKIHELGESKQELDVKLELVDARVRGEVNWA